MEKVPTKEIKNLPPEQLQRIGAETVRRAIERSESDEKFQEFRKQVADQSGEVVE